MKLYRCGYDEQRNIFRRGSCHAWLTDGPDAPPPEPFGHPLRPQPIALWRDGAPYCKTCSGGFKVRHLGHGVFMRPKEEGDG